MADFEKVTRGLAECIKGNVSGCLECPYYADQIAHRDCVEWMLRDALALLKEQEEKIESLTEDIDVWKKRYKVMVLECKTSDDPNKEPAIVRYYTTEEVEQGKAVAFPND